ncbi:MAG: flagellar motor switch protein FliG [Nitrospinota bacterium]
MARKQAPLSGPEKAAVLMISLGEEIASKVLANMDDKEIHQVVNYMSQIDDVTPAQIEAVTKDFFNAMEAGEGGMLAGGKEYLRKMLGKNMDVKKVDDIMNRIMTPTASEEMSGGLDAIQNLDTKTISGFLRNEHPQTAAIVLAHLESAHAAEVLKDLPERFQSEVMLRLATLERISPSTLQDLDQALAAEFHEAGTMEGSALGGVESVAEIVNNLDHNMEVSILSEIEGTNPELAENIRQLMFVFEDLTGIDDRGMQAVLKEISSEDLQISLKTASETLKEKIYKNMSKRAAQMLKEDLQAMGPVRLSEVEKAQQNILRTVKKLEEEGKVVLATGGEELV